MKHYWEYYTTKSTKWRTTKSITGSTTEVGTEKARHYWKYYTKVLKALTGALLVEALHEALPKALSGALL